MAYGGGGRGPAIQAEVKDSRSLSLRGDAPRLCGLLALSHGEMRCASMALSRGEVPGAAIEKRGGVHEKRRAGGATDHVRSCLTGRAEARHGQSARDGGEMALWPTTEASALWKYMRCTATGCGLSYKGRGVGRGVNLLTESGIYT